MDNVQRRRIRVRNIPFNPFLLNNGIVLKGNFILFLMVVFEFFLTCIMYIDYNFFTYPNKDLFELLNQIGGDIFILHRYIVLHYIDNLIIDTFNSWLSDLKFSNITIPHFLDYVNYNNFSLSYWGKIEIISRLILTIIMLSLIILQIKEQQKLRDIGLHSLYSPLLLISFSYLLKDYIFLKRVPRVKRDNIKGKEIEIIELFFTNSKIYKENKPNQLGLNKETKKLLWGFYNYYRFSIYKIPPKK